MDRFLYGASIQGIQSFIFQTNKLKEIAGASDLVEQICTSYFEEKVGSSFKKENLILGAAGNIRYIFENKKDCEFFVRKFPKEVLSFAPGVGISQALVSLHDKKLNAAIDEIEIKLKLQRNKILNPTESGFMGLARSRRTGGIGAVIHTNRKGVEEIICEATHAKRKISDQEGSSKKNIYGETLFRKVTGQEKIDKRLVALDIADITKSGKNSWIAVIHADGNGVGNIIQKMGMLLKDKEEPTVKKAFSQFSEKLEEATVAAIQEAFLKIDPKEYQEFRYPIRPIILGGDDVTIIIRADLALNFTETFLSKFEQKTKDCLDFLKKEYNISGFENGISACAGIAYIKESYPFHYAVDLSEKLCKEAKSFVTNIVPQNGEIAASAISFFKVQDSFIENNLTILKKRTKYSNSISFDYGPYLIKPKNAFASVNQLRKKLDALKKEADSKDNSKGISKLRQWITELYHDKTTADFMLDRMKVINEAFYKELEMDKERENKTIIYDVMQLHQLNY